MENITYTCNGPRVMTPELQTALSQHRDTLKASGDFDALRLFAKSLATTMDRADKLTDDSTVTEVEEQLIHCLNARKGCGTNTTALIEALPFDGVVREVACPTCETVTKVVRTPRNAEDVAAADAVQHAKLADLIP